MHHDGMGGPKPPAPPPSKGGVSMEWMAPSTIVVSLPADAVLTIENQPTISTSEVRRFVTPELRISGQYQYTLKAEITRDGQKLTASKDVVVSGGKDIQVAFDFPTAVAQR
jgi:uncharacterized protein (TIGR03000 family)